MEVVVIECRAKVDNHRVLGVMINSFDLKVDWILLPEIERDMTGLGVGGDGVG